jgi:cytochrome b6-f complex iron-sulfur subunit
MKRRDSIQKFLLGGTVLFLAPSVLQSCSKNSSTDPGGGNPPPPGTDITIDLTLPQYAALNNAGGAVIVQTIIVVNTTGTSYIALSSVCTHQGCTVGYDTQSRIFQCPCHGSQYAQTGSVINGPATIALKSFPVSKSGNILTIPV